MDRGGKHDLADLRSLQLVSQIWAKTIPDVAEVASSVEPVVSIVIDLGAWRNGISLAEVKRAG